MADSLYCHLDNYRLTNPLFDEWESLKNAVSVWADCWYGEHLLELNQNTLSVFAKSPGLTVARISYNPAKEYSLYIGHFMEGEWIEDSYLRMWDSYKKEVVETTDGPIYHYTIEQSMRADEIYPLIV